MFFSPLFRAAHSGSYIDPASIDGVVSVYEGSTLVVDGSSNAERWDDPVSSNDISQATPGSRMAIIANWRNGRSAVQGAAGKSLARSTFASGVVSQPGTVFVACDWDSTGGSNILFDGSSSRWIIRESSGNPALYAGSSNSAIGSSAVASAPSVAAAEFNGASSHILVEQSGQPSVEGTVSPGTGALNGLHLGRAAAEWDGAIGYILIVNRILPAAEKAAVMQAIRIMYAI